MDAKTKQVECQGCDQIKTVPMIWIDVDTYFEGLCADCVTSYGMQVGDKVRLRQPDANGDTELMFVMPEINAIRVRSYQTGLTRKVSWSEFDNIK